MRTMLECSISARKRRSEIAAAIASWSPVSSRPLRTTQRSDTARSTARYTQPRPPCARQPATSYWPWTMSPPLSLGTKEYGWPHLVQKPSVRPGRSPRARPTGAPQSEREQNRLRSGTSGFSSTIARGSGRGTCGTCTRPAPSRPREEPEEEPELRTDTERPVDPPDRDRESRPDTERRDLDD